MKFLYCGVAVFTFAVVSCSNAGPSSTASYLHDADGQPCEPELSSFVPLALPLRGHNGQGSGKGGHNSPTGIAGDNIDDSHSGKVDCYWDGNSGQGNDKGGCLVPAGCDADGCCENSDDERTGNPDGDVPDGGDPNGEEEPPVLIR